MTESKTYKGHLMVLATILIYSFNTNFIKIITPAWIGPEGLVLMRCLASALCFWVIGLFLHPGASAGRPGRKDILVMLAGGALGMGGNLLLYIRGLSMTGPVDAFVIRTVQPIIVMALSIILLHGKLTANKAWGVALGLIGTLYISIMPHSDSLSKDSFSGDLLIFLAAICNGLFLVLIKPYTVKFNSVTVMKWMSLGAVLISLPFGTWQLINAPVFHGGAEIHIWLELAYTLVFATLIAYFLGIEALNYISPFAESVYIYLLPVTGATVSILMGLQKFSWHDPISLTLIVIGFLLINRKPSPKTQTGKK